MNRVAGSLKKAISLLSIKREEERCLPVVTMKWPSRCGWQKLNEGGRSWQSK